MQVARTRIGSTEVLIEAVGEDLEISGSSTSRQTAPTGLSTVLQDAYTNAKDIVSVIATDLGERLASVVNSGQKIQVEFSLALSSSTGLWVISGKTDVGLKVTLSWERDKQ